MLFRTHIVFAVFVYFLLNLFLDMPWWIFVPIVLGAAVVDIDEKNSKVGNKWVFRPLQWLTRHRGMFHSLVFCVLISLVVGMVNLWAGFGFFVGYFSHLLIDCFTVGGVALFWPFKFRVRGFIKSGSWVEDVVFVLLLLAVLFFILRAVLNIFF